MGSPLLVYSHGCTSVTLAKCSLVIQSFLALAVADIFLALAVEDTSQRLVADIAVPWKTIEPGDVDHSEELQV